MNERNMMKEEFIGIRVRIDECTDPSLRGVEGVVVDETKNMMVIESGKIRKVPKNIAVFDMNGIRIDGRKIRYRPEDRIRKIK